MARGWGKTVVGLFWAVLMGLWWVLVLPLLGFVFLGWYAGLKVYGGLRRVARGH